MSRGGDIIMLDGMRDLKVAFQRADKDVEAAAMEEYKKVSQRIIAEAQRNLKDNGSVATGVLRRSGKVQQVDDTTLDVGFFGDTNDGYAFFVEYGRRSGKMPPVDRLEQWLRKKTSVARGMKSAFNSAAAFGRMTPDAYRTSLAWAIAKGIAKHGTKPHPFFKPAIDKYKGQITKALTRAINKVTR